MASDWRIIGRHSSQIHIFLCKYPLTESEQPARPKVYFDFLWQGRLRSKVHYDWVVFFKVFFSWVTRLFLKQQRTTEECFMVETKWCWHWNIYERLKITDLHHKSIALRLFRQSRSSDVDVSRNFYSIRVFVKYTFLSKICTYFMSVMLTMHCLFGSDAGKIMNIWLALFQESINSKSPERRLSIYMQNW